jgi:hypothetical protein
MQKIEQLLSTCGVWALDLFQKQGYYWVQKQRNGLRFETWAGLE